MMRISLVSVHPHRSPQAVPLACAFLKSALLSAADLGGKVEVELVDFFLDDPAAQCAHVILERAPELVGFSCYLWNRDHLLAVAKELKQKAPQIKLCAGGPEASSNPFPLLDGSFDFVICGEGEEAFVEGVRAIRSGSLLAGIPGLLLPGQAPPPPSPPVDLQSLPSPYLTGILDPCVPGGALWQLSRGCDFACAFCFDNKGAGGVRRFGMERIEQELRLFARLSLPQVFVLDSTFNKIPDRAKEILRLIRKLAPAVHFHFEVRSEYLDAEMAELFASITCSLQIGLQSADRDVLRQVGRGFDRDDFSYRVSLLNRSGAIFGFDLIYGLPGDTPAIFRESLDFALSLYPNHLDIFPLAVLPGTRLHGKAEELGLQHLPEPPYTLLFTPGFSQGEIEEAALLATACDIFYSRGKAVAWFNSVVAALKLKPSTFLASFSEFLVETGRVSEEEIAEPEIWELQKSFLSRIFGAKKKSRLLPLALDLARYHHLYALALLSPPSPYSGKRVTKGELFRRPLTVAPSAFLGSFNYEILDILEAGDIDLPDFVSCFRPAQSWAVVYPAEGEVCTESLSKPYYDLLLSLDGKSPAETLLRKLAIPAADAFSFLEFAVSEGIIRFA